MASRKGKPNKSTAEIKTLIDDYADMRKVIQGLVKLSSGPLANVQAIKLLLEYRFGKPRDMGDEGGVSDSELRNALKAVGRAMVSNSYTGIKTPDGG